MPETIDTASPPKLTPSLSRVFPTDANPVAELDGCLLASPVLYKNSTNTWVITADSSGEISALDPETGAPSWSLVLPAPENEDPVVVATPLIVNDLLFVSYHTTPLKSGQDQGTSRHSVMDPRLRHRVTAINLLTRTVDTDFGTIDLEADLPSWDGAGTVPFLPSNALGRGAVVRGTTSGDTLGKIYLTFGNGRDIQPWHGWAFEVDLDSWRDQGAEHALSASLVSTPEADCGPAGASGSTSRICGGGIWAPSGPLVIPRDESYELILPTGNGVLDLARSDYANTLMRTGPGLSFEPECDETLCANFDPDAPALPCVESCANLFIPRLMEGQSPPQPSDGRCDGLTLFQCWEEMDYIGGSTPVYLELELEQGLELLAFPAKDGHVYLLDAQHLGTLYDRKEIAAVCGSDGDSCAMFWAGMIVTQPALTNLGGVPTMVIPTFMPDSTHPAGVVALEVHAGAQGPYLEIAWTYPDFESSASVNRFRIHPSRPRIAQMGPQKIPIAWVVETAAPGKNGRLIGVDMNQGEAIADFSLQGPGMRFTQPLVHEDRIYINHCGSDAGPSFIEALKLSFSED